MADVQIPSIAVVEPEPTSVSLGVVSGGQVKNLWAGPSFGQLAAPEGAGRVGMLDGRTVEERIAAIPDEVDAAGTAEAKVVEHNDDGAAHPALSTFITTEADRAEAAANAAELYEQGALDSSGLFVDIPSFDSVAADGKMGGIKSADPNVAYALAQKVGGVSSLTGAEMPSKAFVESVKLENNGIFPAFPIAPMAWALTDASGSVAMGVTQGGKAVLPGGMDQVEIAGDMFRDCLAPWLFAVSDADGYVAFGVRTDGSVYPESGGGTGGSHWYGKGWGAFGDSITDSKATETAYPPLVADRLGMNLFDYAKSGSRVRDSFVYCTSAAGLSTVDVATIAHGTNDFMLETPMGTIADPATLGTTFYGDYKYVIETMLAWKPSLRIALVTPIRRTKPADTDSDTNSLGFKLIDYRDAVMAIADYYGLPVLDLFNRSGFNTITMPTWTTDGLHPTAAAQADVMSPMVAGFLDGI